MALVLCLGIRSVLWAANSVIPGTLATPYPTITNLAVEWELTGDDNLNCTASVEYRQAGTSEWRPGLPLRRIPAGRSMDSSVLFTWKNKLSGSVFGLRPGTEYEIRLRLSDPDGGAEERTVTATTRRVPHAPADSVVKAATMATFSSVVSAARPGDVIVLAPGNYGEGKVVSSGTLEKPITIRGTRVDTSASVFSSFSLRGCKYVTCCSSLQRFSRLTVIF